MKYPSTCLFAIALALTLAPAVDINAQDTPHTPPAETPIRANVHNPMLSAPRISHLTSGVWVAPQVAEVDASILAPQSTGGPDDFGYAWNDAAAYHWIDATGGTDTGLSAMPGQAAVLPSIDLGFSFPFYENTYSQINISSQGAAGFKYSDLAAFYYVPYIPSSISPRDFIAPFFNTRFGVQSGSYGGHIYYLPGGTAPNRYFVIQWDQLKDTTNSTYTFEAVLYESGNIDFSYKTVTIVNGYGCDTAAGIEDSSGFNGLAYKQLGCNSLSASVNHTVHFTRPAASARLTYWPKKNGQFGYPGLTTVVTETILNSGSLGADTYELATTSGWPVSLFESDGLTPLADSNGNGSPDTGMINQGASRDIVIKASVPASATVGQYNTIQLRATSSLSPTLLRSVPITLAVPAPFAQGYGFANRTFLNWYRQDGQQTIQPTPDAADQAAAATGSDGNVIEAWYEGRTNANGMWVYEVFYAIFDKVGNNVRPATQATDNSTAATDMYDLEPAVAIAPDGSVAITFKRHGFNANDGTLNQNVYLLILDSTGNQVALLNLTNNSQWVPFGYPNQPLFFSPRVVTTPDNRFVTSWEREVFLTVSPYQSNTPWYAIYSTSGSSVKTTTQFGADTCAHYGLGMAPLADGSVFLVQSTCSGVGYGRVNSSGSVLKSLTSLTSVYGYNADAAQLSGGNIVVAWSSWNGSRQLLAYAVLNSSLAIVKAATVFPPAALTNDDSVSIARSGNRAVITWEDACCGHLGLYYTLVNSAGSVTTPPMIYAIDPVGYNLYTNHNGQASTWLPDDVTPPGNPTLTSTSHLTGSWSNNPRVSVAWSGAVDLESGIDGYSYVWDHSASTLPPTTTKTVEQDVTGATSPVLADGTWYFHIRTVDNAGNWATSAAHIGPFLIDTVAPTGPTGLSSISHMTSTWSNNNRVVMQWSGAADALSGLLGYSVIWNQSALTIPDISVEVNASLTTTTSSALTDGAWYFHIRAVDKAGNPSATTLHLGPFWIDTVPPVSTAISQLFAIGPFSVTWSGSDVGSGIASYNLWVRDGISGTWSLWLANTTTAHATYNAGVVGHTYYFRSQAFDYASNVEPASQLPPEGDSNTTVAAYSVAGHVYNNRNEPVFDATVSATPPSIAAAASDGQGAYTLYFTNADTYTLTAQRNDYGWVPPLIGVGVSGQITGADLTLLPWPPEEALLNGTFESGDLAPWGSEPRITAVVESEAANTGLYGARLVDLTPVVAQNTPVIPGIDCITQTAVISAGWHRPTLSWMYRVVDSDPVAMLIVGAQGVTTMVSRTMALTASGWKHGWLDLSPLSGETVTVCIGYTAPASPLPAVVTIDDVSVGESRASAIHSYLPIVMR